MQGWQVKDKFARTKIKSVAGEELDNQLTLINDKLDFPLDVGVSGNIVYVEPAKKQKLASNGTDGTQNDVQWRVPVVGGVDYNTVYSTIDLTTGNTTGDFASNPDAGKSVSGGQYIQMGIALRSDRKFYIVWGDAHSASASTTPPAFGDDDIQRCVLMLKNNGTSGAWNFNTPVARDLEVIPAGVGAGGGGSGNANEILERIKNNVNTSLWMYSNPVVFATDKDTKTYIAGSSAIYDVVNKAYKFVNIGDDLETLNLLGDDFNAQLTDIPKARLDGFVDLSAYDASAAWYLSRDGANEWQAVTMTRDGVTDFLTGELTFADESTFAYAPANFNGSSYTLNASNYYQTFIDNQNALNKVIRQINLTFTKTGSPSGYVKFEIAKDDSGAPGEVVYASNWIAAADITTGVRTLTPSVVLGGFIYWLTLSTDAAYKASYSAGVTQLSFDAGNLKGRPQDLRIKVVSGSANKLLKGLAVYHTQMTAGAQTFEQPFFGDTQTKDVDYNVLPTDRYIRSGTLTGNRVYTLPSALGTGHEIIFKKTDATGNSITALPKGSDTIDGGANWSTSTQNAKVTLKDAAVGKWEIIA